MNVIELLKEKGYEDLGVTANGICFRYWDRDNWSYRFYWYELDKALLITFFNEVRAEYNQSGWGETLFEGYIENEQDLEDIHRLLKIK